MDCCSASSGSLPCTQGEGEEGGSGPAGQGGPGSLLAKFTEECRGICQAVGPPWVCSVSRCPVCLFSITVPCVFL